MSSTIQQLPAKLDLVVFGDDDVTVVINSDLSFYGKQFGLGRGLAAAFAGGQATAVYIDNYTVSVNLAHAFVATLVGRSVPWSLYWSDAGTGANRRAVLAGTLSVQ